MRGKKVWEMMANAGPNQNTISMGSFVRLMRYNIILYRRAWIFVFLPIRCLNFHPLSALVYSHCSMDGERSTVELWKVKDGYENAPSCSRLTHVRNRYTYTTVASEWSSKRMRIAKHNTNFLLHILPFMIANLLFIAFGPEIKCSLMF